MDEKAKAKRFKKRSKKEIILILLTVLFLTAAIISLGIYFYETVIVDEIDKSTVEKLEETIDLDLSTDTNIKEDTDEDDVYTEPAPEIVRVGVDEVDIDKISFINYDREKLTSSAPEAVGWFFFPGPKSVSGLPISNPLMQADNNEYYLNHDFSGSENINGAIFVDCAAVMPDITTNRNTVIYGHARSKQKFGGLKYLNEAEAWYANAYNHFICITTSSQRTVWQIFSWYESTADSDYRKSSFPSDTEYLEYLDLLQSRNVVPAFKKFDFSADDRIITLSTCKGTDKNKRVVVHAVLVKSE